MNKIFEGILHKIVETYLDDIIIFSLTLKDHVTHVKEVVQRLLKHVLKIRLDKCKIAEKRIEYLSHIVYHGCIQPNPAKVRDLLKYSPPLNRKQTQALLGKASYYKRFMKDFATIVSPLNEFLIDTKSKWSTTMTTTVEYLQKRLTSEPILILPRINEPFQLETDASAYGVGGVLAQKREENWLPVAYFSRRLNKCERNYSTTEKELYAIVLSIEYFRQFLYGIEFQVWTDHKPLKYMLTTKELASRLLRWLNRLSMYNYTVEYRKGIKNGNADGLSRLPTEEDENENNDSDEPIIINIIIADNDELDENQTIDENLQWIYALKVFFEYDKDLLFFDFFDKTFYYILQ